MIRRRDQLRVPGALGCAAFVATFLTACDDGDADYVKQCAQREPVMIVEDRLCERSDAGQYGWYYQQIPKASSYDEDGYATYPDMLLVGPGGYPSSGGARGFVRPPIPDHRITTAPPLARGQTTTFNRSSGSIVRGGFGVKGAGSSGS